MLEILICYWSYQKLTEKQNFATDLGFHRIIKILWKWSIFKKKNYFWKILKSKKHRPQKRSWSKFQIKIFIFTNFIKTWSLSCVVYLGASIWHVYRGLGKYPKLWIAIKSEIFHPTGWKCRNHPNSIGTKYGPKIKKFK